MEMSTSSRRPCLHPSLKQPGIAPIGVSSSPVLKDIKSIENELENISDYQAQIIAFMISTKY